MLMFVLKKPALVEFAVFQLAPDCRPIGSFRVAGHSGVNRVRFRGRVGHHVLDPGTYRIRARTLPRGRAVVDIKLVVVVRPERKVIESARGADACSSNQVGNSTSSRGTPGTAKASPARAEAEQHAQPSRAHGVLGAKFAKDAVGGVVKRIPPLLFVLLGIAIGLLSVAALPLRATPTQHAAVTLAHHRGAVSLVGAALLVAVGVAYVLL